MKACKVREALLEIGQKPVFKSLDSGNWLIDADWSESPLRTRN